MKNKDVCLIGKDLVLRRAINDGYFKFEAMNTCCHSLTNQTQIKDGGIHIIMIEKQGTFLGPKLIDTCIIDISFVFIDW